MSPESSIQSSNREEVWQRRCRVVRRSLGQEWTLKRSDGKFTPLIGMSSGCLFHFTLKPNAIQRKHKILMFIKLSDVDHDATLAKADIKINNCLFTPSQPWRLLQGEQKSSMETNTIHIYLRVLTSITAQCVTVCVHTRACRVCVISLVLLLIS